MTRLEELVEELDGYLPATVKNQGLRPDGPTGPGTLKGFHAKIAQVFQLGRSVGHDEAVQSLIDRAQELAGHVERLARRDEGP